VYVAQGNPLTDAKIVGKRLFRPGPLPVNRIAPCSPNGTVRKLCAALSDIFCFAIQATDLGALSEGVGVRRPG